MATDLNLKLSISFVLVIHKHKTKHSVKNRLNNPEYNWHKLNMAGAYLGKLSVARGSGWGDIWDHVGLWIIGYTPAIVVASSLDMELWAHKYGLSMCLKFLT